MWLSSASLILYLRLQETGWCVHRVSTFLSSGLQSFIHKFEESFASFDPTETVSIFDYHQLLCLLCPSFPINNVYEAARVLSANNIPSDSATSECRFGDISTVVQMSFFYSGGIFLLLRT